MEMKNKKVCPSRRGFTILELIIVAGILALITMVISQVLFSTIRSNTKSEVIKEVKQNGDFALETMVRMIQNAKNITAVSCSDDGATKNIAITLTNQDDGQTTFQCSLDNGVNRIASVSASTEYLISSNLILTDSAGQSTLDCNSADILSFSCFTVSGIPKSVQIQFGLRQKNDTTSQFEASRMMFQSTVVLRN